MFLQVFGPRDYRLKGATSCSVIYIYKSVFRRNLSTETSRHHVPATRDMSVHRHRSLISHILGCINPLNTELNPICYLLALLGAHHFLHVSRIRVKLLTFRLLMSYIHGAPILDVYRSHTTTQHGR